MLRFNSGFLKAKYNGCFLIQTLKTPLYSDPDCSTMFLRLVLLYNINLTGFSSLVTSQSFPHSLFLSLCWECWCFPTLHLQPSSLLFFLQLFWAILLTLTPPKGSCQYLSLKRWLKYLTIRNIPIKSILKSSGQKWPSNLFSKTRFSLTKTTHHIPYAYYQLKALRGLPSPFVPTLN